MRLNSSDCDSLTRLYSLSLPRATSSFSLSILSSWSHSSFFCSSKLSSWSFRLSVCMKTNRKEAHITTKSPLHTRLAALGSLCSLLLHVCKPLSPEPSWRAPPWWPGSPQIAAGSAGPVASGLGAARCGCGPDFCPAPSAPCAGSRLQAH